MFQKIFAYCERAQDPTFWAEPLNAVTNAAFIIAAVLATRLWLQAAPGQRGMFEGFLVLLIYAMGIGSFLFHTFAEPWSAIADVVPIGIFMVSYLGYALRRYVGLGWVLTFVVLAAFFISLWQTSVARCDGGPCFNGSLAYFPAFTALVIIGAWLIWRQHAAGWSVLGAGVIFAVSLTARTIDRDICAATGMIGSHFIWHVLNATLLYILARAALLHGRAEQAMR